jgi:hypothetical protein
VRKREPREGRTTEAAAVLIDPLIGVNQSSHGSSIEEKNVAWSASSSVY